jgi:FkbM family methyltransferase
MKFQSILHKIRIILKIIKITKNSNQILKLFLKNKCPILIELKNGIKFKTNENILDAVAVIENFSLENKYDRYLKKSNEEKCIIDIVANIGTFSVYIGKKYPSSKLFCYEPDRENFEKLAENLQMNLISNIKIQRKAVGKENAIIKLFSDESGKYGTVGSSTMKKGPKEIEVECTTLESILNDNQINSCDLLKLDCEGAEYNILMNTDREIFKKIKLISLEYHNIMNHDCYELKEFLESLGFIVELAPDNHNNKYGFIYAQKK